MSLADELVKLQQLKSDGVLSDDEFARAKQKLLQDDEPDAPPPPAPTLQISLNEGLDDFIDEKSTLGGAANRYVEYQYRTQVIGVIIFLVVALIFAMIFFNAQSQFDKKLDKFPGGSSWEINR